MYVDIIIKVVTLFKTPVLKHKIKKSSFYFVFIRRIRENNTSLHTIGLLYKITSIFHYIFNLVTPRGKIAPLRFFL